MNRRPALAYNTLAEAERDARYRGNCKVIPSHHNPRISIYWSMPIERDRGRPIPVAWGEHRDPDPTPAHGTRRPALYDQARE